MITKQDYIKAKIGTAFYWIDYDIDGQDGLAVWIFVKITVRIYIVFFGCDVREQFSVFAIDDAGKIEDIRQASFENWKQVEKETQDLIYPL